MGAEARPAWSFLLCWHSVFSCKKINSSLSCMAPPSVRSFFVDYFCLFSTSATILAVVFFSFFFLCLIELIEKVLDVIVGENKRVFMRTNSLQTEFAFVDDSALSIERFSKRSQGCSLPRPRLSSIIGSPANCEWPENAWLKRAFIVYAANNVRRAGVGQQERGGRGCC